MERYANEQRFKVIQVFYKNGRSNQNPFRALRDSFGQHNHSNSSTIGRTVKNI